jgi:hypothetical protein
VSSEGSVALLYHHLKHSYDMRHCFKANFIETMRSQFTPSVTHEQQRKFEQNSDLLYAVELASGGLQRGGKNILSYEYTGSGLREIFNDLSNVKREEDMHALCDRYGDQGKIDDLPKFLRQPFKLLCDSWTLLCDRVEFEEETFVDPTPDTFLYLRLFTVKEEEDLGHVKEPTESINKEIDELSLDLGQIERIREKQRRLNLFKQAFDDLKKEHTEVETLFSPPPPAAAAAQQQQAHVTLAIGGEAENHFAKMEGIVKCAKDAVTKAAQNSASVNGCEEYRDNIVSSLEEIMSAKDRTCQGLWSFADQEAVLFTSHLLAKRQRADDPCPQANLWHLPALLYFCPPRKTALDNPNINRASTLFWRYVTNKWNMTYALHGEGTRSSTIMTQSNLMSLCKRLQAFLARHVTLAFPRDESRGGVPDHTTVRYCELRGAMPRI